MKDKRGLVWNEIAWWILGLIILALVIILIVILQKRGITLLAQLKNFLRFGR